MNRPLTALFAALEALLVVGVGIGIPLVPLTLMWAFQYGLQVDWAVFWRAAVDTWLLGHGTDLTFTPDPALAAALGLPGAGDTVVATIALLGFALITVALAVRAGRRISETPHPRVGLLVSVAVFAVLSLGATATALHPLASPSLWQGSLLPTLVFALGVAIGFRLGLRAGVRKGPGVPSAPGRLSTMIDDRVPQLRRAVVIAATGGVASVFLVLAVSALALAIIVGISYGRVIGLYEGVQSGVLGGIALTVVQLAFVPNLVIWTASWFVGPGFAVGVGSSVSPLGTVVGPIPAIPVLGALPAGDWAFAFVGILVPVLAGFVTATVLRPRLLRAGLDGRWWLLGSGAGIGVVGGLLLGALAWASAGAAGPGRLSEVGPSFLAVGGWGALEIGLAAVLALAVAGLRTRTPVSPPR